MARIEIDLRAEVRYPERQVTVRIAPERLGRTSMTTRELVLAPSGEVAAEAPYGKTGGRFSKWARTASACSAVPARPWMRWRSSANCPAASR